MNDDFRAAVGDLTREVAERHTTNPGLSVPLVARAARRRRRRRQSLLVAGAAAGVSVLALTASALALRTTPPPPAGTPTPVSSVAPSPSPTPTAPAPTRAAKGDPAEPDAWAMTDATWDAVGPGWAITVFSTVDVIPDDDAYGHFDPAGTQALFLVAPDETTYRLVSLPGDSFAQVMWWDPDHRKAWVYLQGLGESWNQLEVDLVSGAVTDDFLPDPGQGRADGVPLAQLSDGRVLWGRADPIYPGPLEGLYWQQTDGSFTTIADGTGIQGGAWLDPATHRIVYLAPAAVDGDVSVVTYDTTSGSSQTDDLGAPPATGCSLADVTPASYVVACDDPETFGLRYYDVDGAGEWHPADPGASLSSTLVQTMLGCGSPQMPWSSNGRVLPAALAEQGWSDAFVRPDEPGGEFPIPSNQACTD